MRKLISMSIIVCMLMSVFAFPSFAGMADEAVEIEVNADITDNLETKDDVRYYKFTLPADGRVSFTFQHEIIDTSSVLWDIMLAGYNENEIWSFSSSGKDISINTRNTYLSKDTYYVRIKSRSSYNWSSTDFNLTVNFEQNNGEYEVEPNDTIITANEIPEANQFLTGNMVNAGDIDFYKFTLPANGRVNITFKHENISSGSSSDLWELLIMNPDETDVYSFGSKGSDATLTCRDLYLAKGDYYIRVKSRSSYSWSEIDYSIRVDFEENSGDYEIEPDNSAKTAAAMFVNKLITGNILNSSDVDYYKFNVESGGNAEITFSHTNIGSTSNLWTVSLFDEYETQLMSFDSTGKTTVIATDALSIEAGVYYIRVKAYSSYNWNDADYKLTVNFEAAEEPPVTTEEPAETTTEPPVTTEEPVETTTEPPVTTEEPAETTTEPPVTTEEPDETTTESPVTTEEPDETTTEPPVTTEEPDETTTEPPVTTNPDIIYGKLEDGDEITLASVILLCKHLVNPEAYPFSDEQMEAADVTHDGIIDVRDALKILRYLCEFIDSLD